MYSEHHNASPINPLPPVIVALALVIVAVELAFQLGARGIVGGPEALGWRISAIQRFGFHDQVFDYMREASVWTVDGLIPFVTYPFVHGSFTHILFGVVLLLALGNYVSQLFSPVAILLIFVLSGAGAAVIYSLAVDTRVPLIGVYPSVYGLIGVYTWMLWAAAEELGHNRNAAFRLIAFLVGIQIVFALIDGFYIGIVADVAGFATGFALATPLAPGGLARIRNKLRG